MVANREPLYNYPPVKVGKIQIKIKKFFDIRLLNPDLTLVNIKIKNQTEK